MDDDDKDDYCYCVGAERRSKKNYNVVAIALGQQFQVRLMTL